MKHPPEHTRELLSRLGNPQEGIKIIHVAGTNGKGSVCAYLNAMLLAGGKKTGLFTSPHLVRINERFQINGEDVSDEQFLDAFLKVEKAAKELGIKEVAIAGGVSANSGLRKAMQENQEKLGWNIYIPKFEYTTDNAAMIAMVAKLKYDRKEFSDLSIAATARYDLEQDFS